MPLSGDLTTITVTGSFPNIAGQPQSGRVVFDPQQPVMDATGKVIFEGAATCNVFNGVMQPVVLPCTDNAGANPSSFQYKISEFIGNSSRVWYTSLPHTLGSTVDLSSLSPASVAPASSAFASNNTWTGTNTFQGETVVQTPVNTGDAATKAYVDAHTGAVSSVNTKTGAVVLAASDVGALPISGGTLTGSLAINKGSYSGTPFISSEDGTANTHGAIVHVLGANGTEAGHYFLWYDVTDPGYLGLSMALGAGLTYNGHPVIALGGYYNGWGVQGSSHGSGAAVFGVLNSNESGRNVSFRVDDNDTVYTKNNTLDDGSGAMNIAGRFTAAASGTGSTGAIVTNDITVKPNSGIGTSASMFLDNNIGQVWEFFGNVLGQFGVYDKTNNHQPITIDAGAPNDSLKIDSSGVVTLGGSGVVLTSGTQGVNGDKTFTGFTTFSNNILARRTGTAINNVYSGASDGLSYSNFELADSVYPLDQNPGGHYWAFSHRADSPHEFWIFNYNGAGGYKNVLVLKENGTVQTANNTLDDGSGNVTVAGMTTHQNQVGIHANPNSTIGLLITPGADTNKGVVISANSATQSANLLEVEDSSFNPVFQVDKSGTTTISGYTTVKSTLDLFGNSILSVNNVSLFGNLSVTTAGSGLQVKEGTNAKQGTAVLVAGSKVVSNTSVTANSRIFLTSQSDGGTPGWLRVSARTAGTSFTITSSSATDTSTVAYEIFEPA